MRAGAKDAERAAVRAIKNALAAPFVGAALADYILDALCALPVEQRMEVMGMTKWDDVAGYEPGTTVPVWIERDADV